MPARKSLFAVFLWLLFVTTALNAQRDKSLPRSNPEAEGVYSEGIIAFLDAATKTKNEFHSIMFLRHGKVIAEGWWNPYSPQLKHTLYSCSKSFTATAVGFAVSEKKLTVNDKVISFFPDKLPDTVSEYLSALRVKDLLSMSVGQDPDPTGMVVRRDSDWVKGFLALPMINQPGSKFLYNSLATYMLSAIVQKVTGQKVIDYLKPRLFDPLGISGIDWEIDPNGINTGGWGLRLKTEDMAKFGQLFLQKGRWNGKQVIPAAWIEEASTKKIIQHPDIPQAKRDSSDWEQGYCYQMWRSRHNSYRADGAFGQYILILPDQDAVIAITSETGNMQDELNLVWKYLLPAIGKNKIQSDSTDGALLKRKLASLSLPVPQKSTASPLATDINGKTYAIDTNSRHLETVSFNLNDSIYTLTWKVDTASYKVNFGSGNWRMTETTRPGPNLLTGAKAHLVGIPAVKTDGSFTWTDDQTLELVLRYIESPHTEKITCHFSQNNLKMDIQNSYEAKTTTLNGTLK